MQRPNGAAAPRMTL